jgi:hypothetical protein
MPKKEMSALLERTKKGPVGDSMENYKRKA